MENRKLISFGKSSYVVSLPSAWVKKNKLMRGDSLVVYDQGAELVFRTDDSKEQDTLKEIIIDYDNKSIDILKTQIISAYINNYNQIIVKSSKIIKNIKDIREIFHSLVAVEVIEQTNNKIVAKDFLDIESASIKNITRRIDVIARSMIIDAVLGIEENNYESIYRRDFDVNKLTHLSFRLIKNSLENPKIAQKMEMSTTDLLEHWLLINSIEKIADVSKRTSRIMMGANLSVKQKQDLRCVFECLQENYFSVMKSFYTRNTKIAFELMSNHKKCIEKCEKLSEENKDTDLASIIMHFKGMQTSVKQIAKIIINRDKGESNGN
jgi:phosphate uptake regulator